MIESTICFLDSGIGGLPYLEWIGERAPHLELSYVADTEYFPYGELEESDLREAVLDTARRIFRTGIPRILVVACNTASVSALDDLRNIAPCPVVGTVPAVKPAAELDTSDPIGVLATRATVDSPYLDRLVLSFADHKEVVRVAAGDIVRFVEERWLDEGEEGADSMMAPALVELKRAGVGSVVIGCTHFLHVLNSIGRAMGEAVPLVDSRDGVGKRILSLLGEEELPSDTYTADNSEKSENPCSEKTRGTFHVTRDSGSDVRYRRFAENYSLQWKGALG